MTYRLVSKRQISAAAIEAAVASLRGGAYTMGRQVEAFERAFATWVEARHAIMVNSGSSANLLALEVLMRPTEGRPQLHPGDEVLVPALAWSTTIWPVIQLGLIPVFVDVELDTLAMDLVQAARLRSDRTTALLLIHPMGRAVEADAFRAFCAHHDMTLIEDCCESMGAHHAGQHVGTFGTLGTFSHYYSHQLPTIEGGMIVTQDDRVADDLRSARAHGWSRNRSDHLASETFDADFQFIGSGYNLRPLDLQGAIGVAHLQDFDASLQHREAIAQTVRSSLLGHPWLRVLGDDVPCASSRRERGHSWMLIPMLVTADAPSTRDEVVARLRAAGVETRPILSGNILRHSAFQHVACRTSRRGYPVADRIMRDGFMIGCHGVRDDAAMRTLLTAFGSLRQPAVC